MTYRAERACEAIEHIIFEKRREQETMLPAGLAGVERWPKLGGRDRSESKLDISSALARPSR